MKLFKLILLSLFVFGISACGNEGKEGSNQESAELVKTNSGKVSISIEDIKQGKDRYNQEGCGMSLVYNNGMDIEVDAQVMIYELKHSKENYLQTGNSKNRTLTPGETDSSSVFFPDFKCAQIYGIEINKVKCSTEKGDDCSDKFAYIDNEHIKFSVELFPPMR